jgi:hypothetical protein
MDADDTAADRDAHASADPGRGQRELLAIGARALAGWIGEVITPPRRVMVLAAALVAAAATAFVLLPLLAGDDGSSPAFAFTFGVLAAMVVVAAWTTVLLVRATRRNASLVGSHPHWRDAALLERSVDSRGRVTLSPGTADRVSVESRRAIASSAYGIPGALVMVLGIVLVLPVLLLADQVDLQMLLFPLYLLLSGSTCVLQARAAGPMALLRDAADAELALPASERPQAPPADPPHGSRLP